MLPQSPATAPDPDTLPETANSAPGRVIVITGAMAAGKSTVAELLASRFARSVHVRGDSFRRMIVNGQHRRKEGFVHFSAQTMDSALRQQSARIGYWLDSSARTPEETVADILDNLELARV